MQLTPREIVDALDKYIIGQDRAKRAVAVALRNRYRRSCLSDELREEITPKNIIMIGPTGVGKTEIARRLAKLVDAPFVKVEATKYTEVGYVGRDVESMVRDLVDAAIRISMNRRMDDVKLVAEAAAEQTLADLLLPGAKKREHKQQQNPLQILLGAGQPQQSEPEPSEEEKARRRYSERERVLAEMRAGKLEKELVEIEVEEQGGQKRRHVRRRHRPEHRRDVRRFSAQENEAPQAAGHGRRAASSSSRRAKSESTWTTCTAKP